MNLRRKIQWAACLSSFFLVAHCSDSGTSGDPGVYVPDAGKDAKKDTGNNPGDDDDTGDDSGGDDDGGSGDDDGGGDDDDAGPLPTDPLKGDGCAGGDCQNPDCKPHGTPADYKTGTPETGFDYQPSFIPNDTVIVTFDDVPDGADDGTDPGSDPNNLPGQWTKKTLAWLKTNNIHADFFINTNNWCGPIEQDPECVRDVVDILQFQNPANHTVHHVHMGIAGTTDDPGCATAAACEKEITDVEATIDKLSNHGRPHLTRFRAPYGEPFQTQDQARLAIAAPVVRKYGVEVDWNLLSGDADCTATPCPYTSDDMLNKIKQQLGDGPGKGTNWGILLMHATYKWTYEVLPKLLGPTGYLKTHGFKTATVEDAICWKYGKHSWEIVAENNKTTRDPN